MKIWQKMYAKMINYWGNKINQPTKVPEGTKEIQMGQSTNLTMEYETAVKGPFVLTNDGQLVVRFTIPADTPPSQVGGKIQVQPSVDGSAGLLEAGISTVPGDFSGVLKNGIAVACPIIVGADKTGNYRVEAGQTYYMNVRVYNVAQGGQDKSLVNVEFTKPNTPKKKKG